MHATLCPIFFSNESDKDLMDSLLQKTRVLCFVLSSTVGNKPIGIFEIEQSCFSKALSTKSINEGFLGFT